MDGSDNRFLRGADLLERRMTLQAHCHAASCRSSTKAQTRNDSWGRSKATRQGLRTVLQRGEVGHCVDEANIGTGNEVFGLARDEDSSFHRRVLCHVLLLKMYGKNGPDDRLLLDGKPTTRN